MDGFIPCCKLLAGGFLGRQVNKSCSAYKGLRALMWHSSFHAAARLPVIHPTLLFMLLHSLEVKKGFVTSQTYGGSLHEGSLESQFW